MYWLRACVPEFRFFSELDVLDLVRAPLGESALLAPKKSHGRAVSRRVSHAVHALEAREQADHEHPLHIGDTAGVAPKQPLS
jgi:hypothetical protein